MAVFIQSGSTPLNPPSKGDLAAGMFHPAPARPAADGSGRPGRAGFSLIELLVAVAIMSTVMAGVTALFLGSLQTVQRGRSMMGGYELARTTLETVQRDLGAAFTARQWGDYYTFYGTPIGFTYVGAARNDGDNLQRVSYAVFQGHMTWADLEQGLWGQWGTDRFVIEEPVFDDELNEFVDMEREVTAYTLVRYVEPEVGDLDNFMVTTPDGDRVPMTELDPEVHAPVGVEGRYNEEYADQIWNLQEELEEELELMVRALAAPDGTPLDEVLTESQFQRVVDQFREAKKRELWIRMLSGDPRLPRFWADPFDFTDPRPRMRDYAIAENVVVTPLSEYEGAEFIPPMLPFRGEPYFEYGRFEHREEDGVQTLPYWLDWHNAVDGVYEDGEFLEGDFLPAMLAGSPFRPRVPEMVALRLPFVLESPHPTAPHFQRVFENEVRIPTGHTRRPAVDWEWTAGAGE